MKKKLSKSLRLSSESIRHLTDDDALAVAGATGTTLYCAYTFYPPTRCVPRTPACSI